ncbi:MAG TPA: hypothetical protein VGF46_11205 [Gaiellales bacterium]|jgi:hypothetical protein
MRMVDAIMKPLPRDSGFAFNEDGEGRAWVVAYAGTGFERAVAGALRELHIEPVEQTIDPET